MNRKERRRMMKKIPGLKNVLKTATKNAMNKIEESFQKEWKESDATLNYGDYEEYEDEEDDIYND